MTKIHAGRASSAASHVLNSPSVKPLCKDLTRLRIEATECSEVLPRVLGLVAQRGLVPLTINFDRRGEMLVIDLAIEGWNPTRQTLLHRVENMVAVRFAELVGGAGPSRSRKGAETVGSGG